MNYATLIAAKTTAGSIASWVNHATIQDQAATIVEEAEAWIYERLRVREMRATASIAFTTTEHYTSFPTDYLGPINLFLDGQVDPLPYLHEQHYRPNRDEDGAMVSGWPTCWSDMDERITLDTQPDEAIAGDIIYYKRPTALSSANTNFLTTRYPSLVRVACMFRAYDFLKRPAERDAERTEALRLIEEANINAELTERRGQRF